MTATHPDIQDHALILACVEGKASAQQALYDRMAGKMFGVCLRYMGDRMEAEDALVNGFVKVFGRLGQFGGQGSLEGWIRRIMVNECLMLLRQRRLKLADLDQVYDQPTSWPDALDQLAADELMELVRLMPDGYRTVFNLYHVEGYAHDEIADMLGISAGTSKSQLSKARQWLAQKYHQLHTRKP